MASSQHSANVPSSQQDMSMYNTQPSPYILGGKATYQYAGCYNDASGENSLQPMLHSVEPINNGTGFVAPVQQGMVFPSTQPTGMPVPNSNLTMYQFNAQNAGYVNEFRGLDPREGYPLVYPYVPLTKEVKQSTRTKSSRSLCC